MGEKKGGEKSVTRCWSGSCCGLEVGMGVVCFGEELCVGGRGGGGWQCPGGYIPGHEVMRRELSLLLQQ